MIVVRIVLALAFIAAGIAKLMKAKPLAEQFEEFGLPLYAMYLVGILEVSGAIGLLWTTTAFLASCGLALLMAGALFQHLKAKHTFSVCFPSLLLLGISTLNAFVAFNDHGWLPR